MHFKPDTLRTLRKIAKSEEYAYFFDNLDKLGELSPEDAAIIDKIANMLLHEFELDIKDFPKIQYFVRMGYCSKR